MNYTYTTTGGIEVFSCSDFEIIAYRYFRYGIGSTLYVKSKAMKGSFHKIIVKDVAFPDTYTDLYIDTLNRLWNSDELVSYAVANRLIAEFVIQRNIIAEQSARMCKA